MDAIVCWNRSAGELRHAVFRQLWTTLPVVWALELLPADDAVARMKAQAHWQTDVLAGWARGTAVGYLATTWETLIFVHILPHGLTVGFAKRF